MTIATDLVTFGPCLNLLPNALSTVLEWLDGRYGLNDIELLNKHQNSGVEKIFIPAFNGGFQGIAFGIFSKLPNDLQPFVINQLQQLAATLGENLAYYRETEHACALERASNITAYADAFMKILPAVEHAIFASKTEMVGFRLKREGDYLAGYAPLRGEELDAAFSHPLNHAIDSLETDSGVRIRIRMPADADALSPLFTILRLRPRLSTVPVLSSDVIQPLGRGDLASLYHGLKRQISEGRGAIAASRKLYLIQSVIEHFDSGETSLSNSKARDFTHRVLAKPIAGYHVAGKAAKRFEADIHKLAPNRFLFESPSTNALRVRWRPKVDTPVQIPSRTVPPLLVREQSGS
jgi:hypothetical protein